MKLLVLLSLATFAYASIYEVPIVKTVVLKELDTDLHSYSAIPSQSYVSVPVKSSPALHLQSLSHPALLGLHYPLQRVTVQYPSGIYHGPHGVGIYDPKLHDELEQAYYRG